MSNTVRQSELTRHLIELVKLYSYDGHDVYCAKLPGNGGRGKRSRCNCHLGEQLRAGRRGLVFR